MQIVNDFDRTLEFEIEIKIETETEIEMEIEIKIKMEIEIEIESNEGGRCKHYKYCCQGKCEYNHINLLFGPSVWLQATRMILKVPSRRQRLSTPA
jgi:hypothetical protein